MDECRAFQPDVDECALHARQHADHTAQVNIAYMAALDAALDMQFLHRSLLDQRDAGLERVTLIRMSSLIAVAVGMGRSSPLSWVGGLQGE